ncbi:hypothetical protein [Rhizobium sp.]|uniref:hypothetical protein n=1 Tax=Rhizobium sp. TaxID=391 RepID=UPI003F7DAA08
MTIGDALPYVAFWMSGAAIVIAFFHYLSKESGEKLRIRADLLKVGIDPDRLDQGGEDQ